MASKLQSYWKYCSGYLKSRATTPHVVTPNIKPVFDLRTSDWIHSNDADFGGKSSSTLVVNPFGGAFTGILSDAIPVGASLTNSAYAAIRSKTLPPILWHQPMIDLEMYEYLAIRAKGDARQYLVNIQTDTWYSGTVWQQRLVFAHPGEWETVLLPLSGFVLTIQGRVAKKQVLINKERIKTIGFSIVRQPGPFSLLIDSISGANKSI